MELIGNHLTELNSCARWRCLPLIVVARIVLRCCKPRIAPAMSPASWRSGGRTSSQRRMRWLPQPRPFNRWDGRVLDCRGPHLAKKNSPDWVERDGFVFYVFLFTFLTFSLEILWFSDQQISTTILIVFPSPHTNPAATRGSHCGCQLLERRRSGFGAG